MNNRNRHMQYRRSIYRKRKIKTIIISSIVAIVVIFSVFMIAGTILSTKTLSQNPPSSDDSEPNEEENNISDAKVIGAYALPLLEDGSNFSDRLSGIAPNASAVCINLNDEDGTLLYRSSLTSKFSNLNIHTDASSLSNSVDNIARDDFYISATLYIPSFAEKDELIKEIELTLWSAVACEAIQEGVGDVLIIAPSLEVSDVEKICEVANRIHSIASDSVVGLAIPEAILTDKNKTALVNKLSKHFNYLSLDTTQYKEEESPVEYIEAKVSGMQLELMYYKMRVLLPRAADAETQQQYIQTIAKYNINSWQVLP